MGRVGRQSVANFLMLFYSRCCSIQYAALFNTLTSPILPSNRDDGRPKYPPLPPSTSYTLSRAPLAFPPPSSAIESLEILRSHLSARLLEARRRSSSLKLLTKSKLSSLLESRLKLSKKQHSTPNPVRINKVHWRYKADLRILDVLIYFTLKDPCLDVAFVLSSKDVRVASKSGVWWKTPLSPRDDEGGTKCCVVEGTLGEIAYKEEVREGWSEAAAATSEVNRKKGWNDR